jgi:hypothetical protein
MKDNEKRERRYKEEAESYKPSPYHPLQLNFIRKYPILFSHM